MTDHITAAELRMEEREFEAVRLGNSADVCRRAAAALDALNARIAELERVAAATSDFNAPQHQADAELGALVRRIREHPATTSATMSLDVDASFRGDWGLWCDTLGEVLRNLDALAASREAEQGVEGPSGWRYRWEDGRFESKGRGGTVWTACAAVWLDDIPTVAALIERHNNGGPS